MASWFFSWNIERIENTVTLGDSEDHFRKSLDLFGFDDAWNIN